MTAHGEQPQGRLARVAIGFDHVVGAMCDAFQNRAIHVSARVGQVQPEQAALGEGVVDGRALSEK